MGRIQEIMKRLGVTQEIAEQVLEEMEMSGLDFSECTQREFNMAMNEAYYEVSKRLS